MLPSEDHLAIGDWVALTEDGAKVLRQRHKTKFLAGGALLGAVALPLALPGAFLASVGIVSAGTGVAFVGGAQLAVGAAGGAGFSSVMESFLENNPEARAIGIVNAKRKRLSRKDYDYSVCWSAGTVRGKSSWHSSRHLLPIAPPIAEA